MKIILIQLTERAYNRSELMSILEKNHGITEEHFQNATYHDFNITSPLSQDNNDYNQTIDPNTLNVFQIPDAQNRTENDHGSMRVFVLIKELLKKVSFVKSDQTGIIVLPPNIKQILTSVPEAFYFLNATYITEVTGLIVDSGVKPPHAQNWVDGGKSINWKPVDK